jgi:hypothetical protein
VPRRLRSDNDIAALIRVGRGTYQKGAKREHRPIHFPNSAALPDATKRCSECARST